MNKKNSDDIKPPELNRSRMRPRIDGKKLTDVPLKYSQLFVPFSKFIPRDKLIKKITEKNSEERIKKYSEQYKAILKLELFL